jgi:hypothetical protein
MRSAWIAAGIVLAASVLGSCGVNYPVPGERADFRALGITEDEARARTDPAIAERLERKPAAGFPAVIAAIRVQGAGYRSYTCYGYGSGNTTVVTVRDVEKQEDFERLGKLPMVRAMVPVNQMVVPMKIGSERDLRSAAAGVQADLALLYTFDTQFNTETTVPVVGVLTLGLFPNQNARVTCTAAAALVDTRTGYVYALAESTDHQEQIANSWTSDSAVDQSRRRAERRAFEGMLKELEGSWKGVVERYAVGAPAPGGAAEREYVKVARVPVTAPPIEEGWDRVPRGVPYRTR